MCHAYLSVEGFSVLPSCPRHHLQPLPIPAEEAEVPRPHNIFLQDFQAPGLLQDIVYLVQVQEGRMEYRLPHGRNLLEKLELEGGGSRIATCP